MGSNSEGKNDLSRLRKSIEDIDQQLLDLFSRRMAVAREVAEFKSASGAPIFDPQREEEVVRLALSRIEPADAIHTESLLRGLMRLSRGVQYEKLLKNGQAFDLGDQIAKAPHQLPELKLIAYQGTIGSYAAQAAETMFPGVPAKAVQTWDQACLLVESGEADLAVLPLENSTAGTVDDVYDLLIKHNLYVWRALSLSIQHCLMALPGSSLDSIRTVISHSQALAQCSDLIRARGWEGRESTNTAFAAAEVAQISAPGFAAIASAAAAADNHLEILQRDICNSHANQTRFIAVGRSLCITPDADRISLALRLPHQSGSLAATLAIFSDRRLNLTKIESRPDLENPWSYLFYLDFEAQAERLPAVSATLLHLSQEMPMLRLLGWYHED